VAPTLILMSVTRTVLTLLKPFLRARVRHSAVHDGSQNKNDELPGRTANFIKIGFKRAGSAA
jgi:hypothetical protein